MKPIFLQLFTLLILSFFSRSIFATTSCPQINGTLKCTIDDQVETQKITFEVNTEGQSYTVKYLDKVGSFIADGTENATTAISGPSRENKVIAVCEEGKLIIEETAKCPVQFVDSFGSQKKTSISYYPCQIRTQWSTPSDSEVVVEFESYTLIDDGSKELEGSSKINCTVN